MEEITLIMTALATGASAGALEALKDDVKDKAKVTYAKLHGLVTQRFRGNPSAEIVLSEHQTDPVPVLGPGRLVSLLEQPDDIRETHGVTLPDAVPGGPPGAHLGALFQRQHFRSAVLLDDDCTHSRAPWLVEWAQSDGLLYRKKECNINSLHRYFK